MTVGVSAANPNAAAFPAEMLGFDSLTPTYTGWVGPPSVREVSRGEAA
jgi:hypothetical protein